MLHRRELLKRAGIGALAAGLPGLMFAESQTDSRLVMVILRGAMDGLGMLPPYGDGNYAGLRGELALPGPGQEGGVFKADGLFGIHPAFEHAHALYRKKQALFVHAVASPYRERSHFDGQDKLENGASTSGFQRDGWLNRALQPLGGSNGKENAIAIAQNTPLILRGDQSVTSWAPSRMRGANEDTLERIESMYAQDSFFATRLEQAIHAKELAEGMSGTNRKRGKEASQTKALLRTTAKFLSEEDGPRIAVLESGGWDTHQRQGASNGRLAGKFKALDQGIAALQKELGGVWSKTVVIVVTEFGRTVKVNGTAGTDHGTATAAMLLGGAVNGGRVIADWPGLSAPDLYEGRDLQPTTDLRSVFKGVLAQHLHLEEGFLEKRVFPDSRSAPIIEDLVRT
jgi:uncharacterized protein (DUF1501 family)